MEYVLLVMPLLCLTAIEALSLNLLTGRLDLICMCQAAFVGVGAYVSAVLTTRLHWPMVIGVLAAVLAGCVLGWCFGFLTASLNKERLVLATLGFQLFFSNAVVNWTDVTSGPEGIRGIPQFTFPSLVLVATLLAILVATPVFFRRTLLGKVAAVLRESESFAAASGFNTRTVKCAFFALGAGSAGLGGALFSHALGYIDPESFSLSESVFLLSAVLISGDKGSRGVLLGVALVTIIPEALRFLSLQSMSGGEARQMLYGAALLAVLLFRPLGVHANA